LCNGSKNTALQQLYVCGFESSACAPRHTSQRQPEHAFTMASFERHAIGRYAGVEADAGQSATVPDAKTPATCPHPFHDSAILALREKRCWPTARPTQTASGRSRCSVAALTLPARQSLRCEVNLLLRAWRDGREYSPLLTH
jgi:hypothetical protein